METKDWVALVSLAISIAAFYRTHLFTRSYLKAVIMSVNWDSSSRTSKIKLLYLNTGNKSEVVAGVQIRYYSSTQWPDNFIGSYYRCGTEDLLFPETCAPFILSPGARQFVEHQFTLSAEDVQLLQSEQQKGKSPLGVLKFKRLNEKGHYFTKIYSRGLCSLAGCPFTLGLCPDNIIQLNASPHDELMMKVQIWREKSEVLPWHKKIYEKLAIWWQMRSLPKIKYAVDDDPQNTTQVKHSSITFDDKQEP